MTTDCISQPLFQFLQILTSELLYISFKGVLWTFISYIIEPQSQSISFLKNIGLEAKSVKRLSLALIMFAFKYP